MRVENFYKLPKEKQETILNAALNEFAMYDYDAASTNRIVTEAGISKGVLFKYFSSKENLFYFVVESYFLKLKDYYNEMPEPEDTFDYLYTVIMLELELTRDNDEMQKFYRLLNRVIHHTDHPVYKKANQHWFIHIQGFLDVCCSKVKTELLREDVTLELLRRLLEIFFYGLKVSSPGTPALIFSEADLREAQIFRLLEIIKQGVYKGTSQCGRA